MLSAPGGSAEKTAKGEIYRVVFLPTARRNAIVLSEGTCPLLVEAIAYLLLGTLLFIYFLFADIVHSLFCVWAFLRVKHLSAAPKLTAILLPVATAEGKTQPLICL